MTFRTPSEIMAYEQGAGSRNAEVARLTRERDAALEALKQASDTLKEGGNIIFDIGGVKLRFGWSLLWGAARAAERTIKDIETGAIHRED